MQATTLRDALDRHRKVLRAINVHVLADSASTTLSSGLITGHVMRSTLPGLATPVNCTVSCEVLASMIGRDGDVTLRDAGETLHVACGRTRGQVPIVTEERPAVPSLGSRETSSITGADATWLREVLPLVHLAKTERDGSTSIVGHDGELRACTYDEVHGAFAYRRSTCSVSIGLLPADAVLFTAAIAGDADLVVRTSDDNRLVVRNGRDVLVLPCIDARAQPRDVVMNGVPAHWRASTEALLEAIAAIQGVARAKDASPVELSCTDGGLAWTARSPSGRVRREMTASVLRRHAPVGLNIALLGDIMTRLPRDATVTAYLEEGDGPSPRVLLRTDAVIYVMLTSAD